MTYTKIAARQSHLGIGTPTVTCSQSCRKVMMWDRVIQIDLVAWSSRVIGDCTHIMCKRNKGIIVMLNFAALWAAVSRNLRKTSMGGYLPPVRKLFYSWSSGIIFYNHDLLVSMTASCFSVLHPEAGASGYYFWSAQGFQNSQSREISKANADHSGALASRRSWWRLTAGGAMCHPTEGTSIRLMWNCRSTTYVCTLGLKKKYPPTEGRTCAEPNPRLPAPYRAQLRSGRVNGSEQTGPQAQRPGGR